MTVENQMTGPKIAAAEPLTGTDTRIFGFSRRQAIFLGGIAAIGMGLFFKWDLLIATGLAPVILSLLPCAAMCALGLCMRGGAKQ